MGRLTADPELRQTQSGIASCRFTVAVNRKYKNEQTGEYDADFITCVAWRQTAEFISRYFSKGKMIALEGTLRTGSYQDRNHDDVTHYTTDVMVDNVEFAGDKGSSSGGQAPAAQSQQKPAQSVVNAAAAAGVQTSQDYDLSEFEEILSDGDVPF
jgi:single-strand DNA-binding protein